MTYVLRDNPAWDRIGDTWLRATSSSGDGVVILSGDTENMPDIDVFHAPAKWPSTMPQALADALSSVGTVARFATPSLWDAIATAIIRQVIRADQARLQHQRFRRAYGPAVQTSVGVLYALPSAETVAGLRREDFRRLGMAFKADALRNAAVAYLDQHAKWSELPSRRLVEELQSIPRIGPWTAGAAVADHTNDWSLYPHGDLAVRTWARTAAPGIAWPTTEPEFAGRWRTITSHHLGLCTLFTLAWGARHAETAAP